MGTYPHEVRDLRTARNAVRATAERRAAHSPALHPGARTFRLEHADVYGTTARAEWVLALVPELLTLVTPDPAGAARDHLFLGAIPVPPHNLRWSRVRRGCDSRPSTAATRSTATSP
ncbi:hypothetical protein ACFQ9X_26445 [Catenulispora yoronensis]